MGKCAAQGSQAALALSTQEEHSIRVAEDKPAGQVPVPCGNWLFKVLFAAATELLMAAAAVSIVFDL